MDEEQFESLMDLRPFGSEDARKAEQEASRLTAVGVALWGRTSAELERQLLAPHPEIPSGVDLDELRKLRLSVQRIVAAFSDSRRPRLLPLARWSAIISVGNRRFTEWEARLEVVRRAIDRLEA